MKIGEIKFSKVYPMYVTKVERKGRTKEELDEVIRWLTGYDDAGIEVQIVRDTDFATLFAEAPALNPNASKITGVICGYRVEEIEDPIEQKVRWMDKLVDEVANGKKKEKINRA
jgi:hypothetical protein